MNKLLVIGVVFALIVFGAFAFLREDLPESHTFNITIQDCKVADGSDIMVDQGDEITLKVTSDIDAELHIHGYDLLRDLVANQEETIAFTVSDAGTFEYGLHGHCSGIGAIKVADAKGVVPTTQPEESHHSEESETDSHGH